MLRKLFAMLQRIVFGPLPITFEWADNPITYDIRFDNLTITLTRGKVLKMKFVLPSDCKIRFVLPKFGRDAKGNLKALQTPPTATVTDETILSLVQPDPATPEDPSSGVVMAAGPVGIAQFVVRDEDESNQPLICLVDFEVVAGDLVALADPTFGPVEKV